jgi:hypothetical protein
MASEAMQIVEKLRLADQLMQAKYKKLRDLKANQEEMKRKILEKTSTLDALKRKQKQDQHLMKQVSADVIMQVRRESSGLLTLQRLRNRKNYKYLDIVIRFNSGILLRSCLSCQVNVVPVTLYFVIIL